MKYKLNFCIYFFLIIFKVFSQNTENIITNNSHAYWDVKRGWNYCWYFDKYGIAIKYKYIDGIRYIPDYGDYIITYYYWKLNNDTIFISADPNGKSIYTYRIVTISENYMQLMERVYSDAIPTIKEFILSNDQIRTPNSRFVKRYVTYRPKPLFGIFPRRKKIIEYGYENELNLNFF